MNEKRTLFSPKVKINRVSIVDQVCDAIKQDISNGVWKEGEKIPSETALAETFGVNRLSIRMALQKLSTLGIIETRVGEGSFVTRFSLKPVLTEIAVFYYGDEKYREVQQLRNLLEGECMHLAIINASTEEKEDLRLALEEYHKKTIYYHADIDDRNRLEQMVDADFAFHYQVIKMSHNTLYKDIYYMVQQLIRSHITQLLSTRAHKQKKEGVAYDFELDAHKRIYESIVNANADEAKKAREEMLGIVPAHGMDYF